MRRNGVPLAVAGLSLAAGAHAQSASATAASKAASASGITQYIPQDFAGFGIEPSNLFSFTGEASENKLTVNLMSNLASYAGKPAHIRLGGNTQDYFLYQVDMDEWTVKTNPNSKGQGAIASDADIIGPRFFEAISRFPKGTPITFGLNLAYDDEDYEDQIALMASAALNNLTNVDLVSFEIGNEPDLYGQNGFRTGQWDGTTYVKEWKARAKAVWERVLKPAGGWSANSFEGPCTASTIGTTFEMEQLVNNGIKANADGETNPYLRAWNQHDYLYFIDVSEFTLTLEWMMTLSNTVDQFKYWATQIGIALKTGLPYYLREMQSVGPTGMQGVSDTFGAALWNLNFFLYAASLNISSVEMHMTDNSYAAPWQPVDRNGISQHVRPVYYAYAAMAQLIGSGNGTTQIAPLDTDGVPNDYGNYVRMYAGYGSGELTSVVLINSKMANSSDTNKGSLDFDITFSGHGGETVHLAYLTAAGAESNSNVTFNGLSFESSGDGTPTTADGTDHTVTLDKDGKGTISVRDTEAVVAYVGAKLGSNAVSTNGTSSSSKKSAAAISIGAPNAASVLAAAASVLAFGFLG
ncbi:glycoside hydrolase family 79 protein [Aplosporella prunicola CBS 121167]|uniref:Glycoside hydrolase family 79 protein n=1 Tax=Aplosporella prunicola CBS 121167 TaxID=1176127 RepID=A0A6A6BQ05_9PEZI|nr:glycoside hydrolase family 79 protein [Aplosporella prunicola CBS 121167]KAF2145828.1 glycoside hydrolase family 79 protein [Aplosporella prunicola CBS 121167]